jgi:hypothetical protein
LSVWSDVSSILQELGRQSTERHDSEHRGPAVVAFGHVSWNRGDDGDVAALALTEAIAVFVHFAGP